MKKSFIVSLATIFLLGATNIASAVSSVAPQSGLPVIKKEVRDARTEFRGEVVKPIKAEIKTLKDGAKNGTKELKEKTKIEIKDLRGEIKQKREEFKAELKKKLETTARARLNKNLDKMDNAVTRLMDINTRIGTRITKLQTAGQDVTSASAALTTANEKATSATNAIDTARTNIASASVSSTTDINLIKEYVKTAEESVKTAKEASAKTISALKGLGKPERTEKEKQASTTESSQ